MYGSNRMVQLPTLPMDQLNVLKELFPDRLVSLREDIKWPARSPGQLSMQFFPLATESTKFTVIVHEQLIN